MNKNVKSYINTHFDSLIHNGINPSEPGRSTIDLIKLLNSDVLT